MKRHLRLDRETIVQLGQRKLVRVVGGMDDESGCTACNPTHTQTCSCETACADRTANNTGTCGV